MNTIASHTVNSQRPVISDSGSGFSKSVSEMGGTGGTGDKSMAPPPLKRQATERRLPMKGKGQGVKGESMGLKVEGMGMGRENLGQGRRLRSSPTG